MKQSGLKIKRASLLCWVVWPATVWLLAIILLTTCTSCATKERIVYEHIHHYQQADTLTTNVQADGHSHVEQQQSDSIMRATLSQWMHDFVAQSQEREVTTETLTETIDSLGRVIRQQQRTTERTLSRQEQEHREAIEQHLWQELSSRISSYDSAWQQRLTQLQTHYEQALEQQRQEQTKPQQQSWWQRTLGKIQFAVIVAILAAALWATRKWWLKIFNR